MHLAAAAPAPAPFPSRTSAPTRTPAGALALALTPLLRGLPRAPAADAVPTTAAVKATAVPAKWYSSPPGGPSRVTVTLDLAAAVGDVAVFDTAISGSSDHCAVSSALTPTQVHTQVRVRAAPMAEMLQLLVAHTRAAEARVAAATSASATSTSTNTSTLLADSQQQQQQQQLLHPTWVEAIAAISFLLACDLDVHLVCHASSEAEETAVTVLLLHSGLLTPARERTAADAAAARAYFGSPALARAVAEVVALAPRPLPRHRMLFCSSEVGRRALVRALVPGLAVEPSPRAVVCAAAAEVGKGDTGNGEPLTEATAKQLLEGLAQVSHVHVCDRAYDLGGGESVGVCAQLPLASEQAAAAAREYASKLGPCAPVGGEGVVARGRIFWSPYLLGYLKDAP